MNLRQCARTQNTHTPTDRWQLFCRLRPPIRFLMYFILSRLSSSRTRRGANLFGRARESGGLRRSVALPPAACGRDDDVSTQTQLAARPGSHVDRLMWCRRPRRRMSGGRMDGRKTAVRDVLTAGDPSGERPEVFFVVRAT